MKYSTGSDQRMKTVLSVIVQCLLISVNLSLCSETICEIESEPCELVNGDDIGECKVISQCESGLFVQNTTYYPEVSDELVCCKHVRHTRGAKWRSRTVILVQPKRYRYEKQKLHKPQKQKATSTPKPLVFHTAVVGGLDADSGEFPFMAALGWPSTSGGYDFRCGGFFVSPNRVVTAGHCVRSRRNPPAIVRPGGASLLDVGDLNPNIPITDIIPHPLYTGRQYYNDIAVLKLSGNSPHPPANLWRSSAINSPSAIAIGYGHTQFAGRSSNVLQKVTLSLFTNSFCSRFHQPDRKLEKGLISSQLCAGEIKKAKDTCQGDSGGPLLVKVNSVPYIVGITSFGSACGGGVPSIYTRISSYVRWIESIR